MPRTSSEGARCREVRTSACEQVKARLKQIEEQFSQHQRLTDELERLRDVAIDLERAFMSRLNGGQPPAAKQTERGKRPTATTRPTASARTPRGQNKAKILDALKAADR